VLVGNANAFVNDLKGLGFGEIERIPIGDVDLLSADLRRGGRPSQRPGGVARRGLKVAPPLAPAAAYQQTPSAAPPADKTQTEQLLRRAVDARGGLEALKKVKTIVAEADTTISTLEGKITAKTKSFVEYPGRMRVEAQLPEGEVVQVYANGSAWVRDPGGVHDAPPEMQAEFEASTKRDSMALLVGAATGALRANLAGEEGHDGRTLKVLEITGDGLSPVRLHIDSQSGAVVKMTHESQAPPGSAQPSHEQRLTEEIFSDYRMVDGVNVAFKALVKRAGIVLMERQLTSVQINPTFPADLFAKPR
jgi:hypothetical protein